MHVKLLRSVLFIFLAAGSHAASAQLAAPDPFPRFFKEGHRGGTGLMPENTIPAMKKAVEVGANVIEVDVYTSKDGKVIVTHDPYINWKISLTKEGKELTAEEAKKYPVHQMNYEDIRSFDVGKKYYAPFPDQRKIATYMPLLDELIDSVEQFTKERNLTPVIYNIELKTSPDFDDVYNAKPEVLVDAVIDIVKRVNIGGRFYIQSFDKRPLQYARRKYPAVALGLLVGNDDPYGKNITQLGFTPDIYSPHLRLVTPELVRQCQSAQCKLIVWTVNTKEDMQRLKNMGVDGIITDYPNYFSELK